MCGMNILKLTQTIFLPAPDAPPTNVTTVDVTSSNITVQWGPVDCIHQNGDITGYSMQYGVQTSGSTQTIIEVPGGATTQHTISGLQCASNYSIEVAGINSAGTGVYSNKILIVTEGIIFHILLHCNYYKCIT